MSDGPTQCGTIVLAGRPNAGKSSLLNRLVGERLAIATPKPQTTRAAVIGLRTEPRTQMIFVDPPGLLEPEYLLHHSMLAEAMRTLAAADAILHLHPALAVPPPPLAALLPDGARAIAPTLPVFTKGDLADDEARAACANLPGVIASATTGEGIEAILEWCRAQLPHAPFRHDPDDLGTQPIRFFAAEYVREAAIPHLRDELPYALATEVDEFREGSSPVYIRVILYVERESQKGIVIGKNGATIKAIGSDARARLEAFLGTQVYLDLWVRTLAKWRSDPVALRRLGFTVPNARHE